MLLILFSVSSLNAQTALPITADNTTVTNTYNSSEDLSTTLASTGMNTPTFLLNAKNGGIITLNANGADTVVKLGLTTKGQPINVLSDGANSAINFNGNSFIINTIKDDITISNVNPKHPSSVIAQNNGVVNFNNLTTSISTGFSAVLPSDQHAYGIQAASGGKINFNNANGSATISVIGDHADPHYSSSSDSTYKTNGSYSSGVGSSISYTLKDLNISSVNTGSGSTGNGNANGIIAEGGSSQLFNISGTTTISSQTANGNNWGVRARSNSIVSFTGNILNIDAEITANDNGSNYGIAANDSGSIVTVSNNAVNITAHSTHNNGSSGWEVGNTGAYAYSGGQVIFNLPDSSIYNINALSNGIRGCADGVYANGADSLVSFSGNGTVNIVSKVQNPDIIVSDYLAYHANGVQTYNGGSVVFTNDVTNIITSNAGVSNDTKAVHHAIGIYGYASGNVLVNSKDLVITSTAPEQGRTTSLRATGTAVIKVNADDNNESLGDDYTAKLTGQIRATGTSLILVNLVNENSFLHGRLFAEQANSIDLRLADGATWAHTEDEGMLSNRYNNTGNITSKNGIVDISWWELNKAILARAPLSITFRDISLSDMAIDGSSILRINSDIEGTTADHFTINNLHNGGTSAITQYVQIAYDAAIEKYAADAVKNIPSGPYTIAGANRIEVFRVDNNDDNINIDFKGDAYIMDGVLTQFLVTPDVSQEEIGGVFYGYLNGIQMEILDEPSDTVKTFSDNVASLNWLNRLSNDNLTLRMGDLKRSNDKNIAGVWAKVSKGDLNTKNVTFNRDILDSYLIAQAGIDRMFTESSGNIYVGALAQYLEDEGSYINGNGDINGFGLGGYAIWLGKNKSYFDFVVRTNNLKVDYNLVNANDERISGNYETWGVTVNGEYGKFYSIQKNVSFQPSIQLTYTSIGDVKHTASNGLEVSTKGNESLIGRLGGDVVFELGNGNFYIGGDINQNFMGSTVTDLVYNDLETTVESEITKLWYKFNIGGNIKLSDDSNCYMELSTLAGTNIESNWQASIGFRYTF